MLLLDYGVGLCSPPASAQARDWPSETPPRPLAAHEVTFPPYEIRTLANGMQVIAVLHHEQPAVSMRLLVGAGAAQDPKGKGGVAYLMASLLDQGTTTRSAQQIADEIDFIGGALGTGAGTICRRQRDRDEGLVRRGMDLLADVVAQSGLRDGGNRTAEGRRYCRRSASTPTIPEYIADVVFDRLVYGFHPYGLPGTGTAESLGAHARGSAGVPSPVLSSRTT